MRIVLNATPFKIVSPIKPPNIIRRVELSRRLLEDFELEHVHVAYQDNRPQLGILLRRLFDSGVPYLQNLIARFLHVGKDVLVFKREYRRVPAGNQANSIYGGRIG